MACTHLTRAVRPQLCARLAAPPQCAWVARLFDERNGCPCFTKRREGVQALQLLKHIADTGPKGIPLTFRTTTCCRVFCRAKARCTSTQRPCSAQCATLRLSKIEGKVSYVIASPRGCTTPRNPAGWAWRFPAPPSRPRGLVFADAVADLQGPGQGGGQARWRWPDPGVDDGRRVDMVRHVP